MSVKEEIDKQIKYYRTKPNRNFPIQNIISTLGKVVFVSILEYNEVAWLFV